MRTLLFESCGISFSSRRECVPENLNSVHCHDKYEILYVIEGQGKYIVEGTEYPIKPRSLMIFPPLTYHCASVNTGTVYERIVINFDKQCLETGALDALARLSSAAENSGLLYTAESLSDAIASVFDRFEIVSELPENEKGNFGRLLLSELVILLSVSKSENFNGDDGDLGARVIRYLNENMTKDITLDDIAKRFFVSKYYLCRAFKKHNGISIHGYINQKRVLYAKQIIESGESASGAAYRVGFGDYSAFYRAYVKIIGRSPTAQSERRENEQ